MTYYLKRNDLRGNDGEPISAYVATDLAIHINAFYLNLWGALDNLAWALQYEHQLFPGVAETGTRRQRVNLFHPKFLDALEAGAATLATDIRDHAQWNTDLKELRDPSAHRIPIYAVPGVITAQQRSEVQRLQENAAELFTAGDFDGGMELMHQSTRIGTYKPLMVLSHEAGLEPRDIRTQVQGDEQDFVEVAEAVLRRLFAPQTTTVDFLLTTNENVRQ